MVDNVINYSDLIEKIDFSAFESKLIKDPKILHLENNNFKGDGDLNSGKFCNVLNGGVLNSKTFDKVILEKKNDDYDIRDKVYNTIFSVVNFNNLTLKNKFCFLCYSDDYFFDNDSNLKKEYFDFYRKISKSNVGSIFTGGFDVGIKTSEVFEKILNNPVMVDKFKNFVNEIHLCGSKIFMTIKSSLGRADDSNKLFNLFTFSASFNRNYFNSILPSIRVSDKICNNIIDEMVKIAKFSTDCKFDGILIDGDLFGFIGEISSSEINKRKFGYFSETYDFSKKLIEKIIKKNKDCNIFYSISIKSYIEEIYGKNINKINSIKTFNKFFGTKSLLNFLGYLVKLGVDGFVIKFGTFETEFLSVPTEFEEDNIFEKIYSLINRYFKDNNIKNKFGKDVELIYKDNFEDFSSDICIENNVLLDLTNQILSDNDYLHKLRKKRDYKNCIRCGYCSDKFDTHNAVSCILSPELYYSSDEIYKSEKINNQETIAVVGSGVSGVNSAIFLAKKGYHVDLFEKDSSLLKNNQSREIFDYNLPLKRYNKYLIREVEKFQKEGNLNVKLNTKFSIKSNENKKYSTIIVATGAKERLLTIPGAVLKNVKSIFDVLSNKNTILNRKHIIINALSELSLSFAQYLLLIGKKVTVIISSIDFLETMQNSKLTYYLYTLNKLKCRVYVFAKINKIESDFVEISYNSKLKNENFAVTILNTKSGASYKFDKRIKNIDMDLFIYEPETYSNNKLYYDLVSSSFDGKVFMIGSALYPCDIRESIKTAYFVAKNI